MRKALIIGLILAAIGAGSASASVRWAGLTKPQAIAHAKQDVIGLCIAYGKCGTPAKIALVEKALDASPVTAVHATCLNGQKAWRVRWIGTNKQATSDPIYLNAKSMLLACR
jgi:hypothetical protein